MRCHFLLSVIGASAAILFTLLPTARLRADVEEFKPVKEADLPDGFPTYTPVGVIEVKEYPAYRKASSSGGAAFWSLFSHIKQNEIAMTAPVEMTYAGDNDQGMQQQSMAFLYGKPSLGTTGKQGNVEVWDVPGMKVVSIGMRGARTDDSVRDAKEKLDNWLDSHSGAYAVSGPLRVMGYNSPFVPRDRQFYEVQIPVTEVGAE